MTPTLFGRIQTRIFALVLVGGIWTLLITPFLPVTGGLVITEFSGSGLVDVYEVTFTVLLAVIVLGVLWELPYHLLQQFRWEKDWPTFFGFVTFVNEGLLVYLLAVTGVLGSNVEVVVDNEPQAYVILFLTTWIVVFLFVNGPIRVLTPRYRFRGGRLI